VRLDGITVTLVERPSELDDVSHVVDGNALDEERGVVLGDLETPGLGGAQPRYSHGLLGRLEAHVERRGEDIVEGPMPIHHREQTGVAVG
jgi:hypothetical protein